MPIKPETERRLREAMERLFSRQALRTDGHISVPNLAKEAGVSRATLYRAESLLMEFQRRAAEAEETPERAQGLWERMRALESELETVKARKNQTIRDLQRSIEILAQQVQGLALENARLREELQRSAGNVSVLHGR